MQSPPAEWALGIGYLVVIDVIRAHGDADSDTLSEVIRDAVRGPADRDCADPRPARHPRRRIAFTAAVALGALAFHEHIVGPLR